MDQCGLLLFSYCPHSNTTLGTADGWGGSMKSAALQVLHLETIPHDSSLQITLGGCWISLFFHLIMKKCLVSIWLFILYYWQTSAKKRREDFKPNKPVNLRGSLRFSCRSGGFSSNFATLLRTMQLWDWTRVWQQQKALMVKNNTSLFTWLEKNPSNPHFLDTTRSTHTSCAWIKKNCDVVNLADEYGWCLAEAIYLGQAGQTLRAPNYPHQPSQIPPQWRIHIHISTKRGGSALWRRCSAQKDTSRIFRPIAGRKTHKGLDRNGQSISLRWPWGWPHGRCFSRPEDWSFLPWICSQL